MATLIPSLSNCTFDTSGERRLAEHLSRGEAGTVAWYNVPVGKHSTHPDFIVMNPRRGLLVLEVKDWKFETVAKIDRGVVTLRTDYGEQSAENPFEAARHYSHSIVDVLRRDPELTSKKGDYAGKLTFPWSFGVVLPNITRKEFDHGQFGAVMPGERVICRDEMRETVAPGDVEHRLWSMIPSSFPASMSESQMNRVRWHLFPEIRIGPVQGSLFSDAPAPDLVRVMDLLQEQLARALGRGHRVIQGLDHLLSNRKPSDLCGFRDWAMKGHEQEASDEHRSADGMG